MVVSILSEGWDEALHELVRNGRSMLSVGFMYTYVHRCVAHDKDDLHVIPESQEGMVSAAEAEASTARAIETRETRTGTLALRLAELAEGLFQKLQLHEALAE